MAKSTARYVCQSCGAIWPKWAGRCETCGEWNTIVEEAVEPKVGGKPGAKPTRLTFVGLEGTTAPPPRAQTGISELDRVLGGGLVAASAVLVGGDPGIGKSTLLLQAAAALARAGRPGAVYYWRGIGRSDPAARAPAGADRRPAGIGRRYQCPRHRRRVGAGGRCGPGGDRLDPDHVDGHHRIRTRHRRPGPCQQFRADPHGQAARFRPGAGGACHQRGAIAGPRVLEHMVDAVLYFEGDRGHQFRILRGVKNRYGPTDEIGVFEMTEHGLAEVPNPSALFLAERRGNIAGSAVFAGLEGTRPVLVEVQALLSPNAGGSPRRSVIGWESGRLAMMLAVLDSRAGLRLSAHDVYLNVAGGLRVNEPAADLAVAAALASAATETPTDPSSVYFGEVGLSGEVRQVAQAEARLKEAQKLGFAAACLPRRVARGDRKLLAPAGLRLNEIGHVTDLIAAFTGKS